MADELPTSSPHDSSDSNRDWRETVTDFGSSLGGCCFTASVRLGCVLLIVVALWFTGLINVTYPSFVDNNPLQNPVAAEHLGDGIIQLADGMKLQFEPNERRFGEGDMWKSQLTKYLKSGGGALELEQYADHYSVIVAYPRYHIPVGMFDGLIRLPLIPVKVPANVPRNVGDARVIQPPAVNDPQIQDK